MQVVVVDYSMGNLLSVKKAVEKLGFEVIITEKPSEVKEAEKIILPGVGAFGAGMENLKKLGLEKTLKEHIYQGKPILGICLGLQLLFSESEEAYQKGLGIISGKVVGFPKLKGLRVPHMGWNEINIKKSYPLFDGIKDGEMVYFAHSFFGIPDEEEVISAFTEHGINFASAISCNNVFGTQFHPEKSGKVGLKILFNFLKLKC